MVKRNPNVLKDPCICIYSHILKFPYVLSVYFLLITGRHKALSFGGKGKGAVLH